MLAAATLGAFCFIAPGIAKAPAPPAWSAGAACGTEIAATAALVNAVEQGRGFEGFQGGRTFSALLVGRLAPPEGGVAAFVRIGGEWKAYAVTDGVESPVGVYVAESEGRVFIFTMWDQEGPGSSYTTFDARDGFTSIRCGRIDFPADLNRPAWANEYLELEDFNIGRNGAGALIGAASVERSGRMRTWIYRYATRDDGKRWGPPLRLRRKPGRLAGRFVKAAKADSADAVRDLEAHAARRR